TVLISEPTNYHFGGDHSGSVYVFVRNGSDEWIQQTKLLPDDGTAEDHFGESVSISGDTIVIGARGDDDNGSDSGSAYVFIRNGSDEWIQQTKLLPDDGTAEDHFGESVSISGDTIVIGASGDDDNGGLSGSAYIYSSIPTTSDVTVTVTAPTSGTTYNHGNQVTINWETENADPADTMVLSMKRDAASAMSTPDDRSWYRFTENTPNDGTETVTIPDSVVAASDWRFYVRHVSSGAYAASGIVEVAEAENVGQLYIEKSGDGLGTVSGAIPGRRPQVLCDLGSTSQTHRFPISSIALTLTAESDSNSVFSGWEGCDSVIDEQCFVTINGYEEVSAQFNATENATVEISVLFREEPYEQGSVVSDPPGINCFDTQGNCRAKFVPGQTVTLTPIAARGAIFEGWRKDPWSSSEPCDSQSGDACIITIPASGRIDAYPDFTFDPQQSILHLTIDGKGEGSVTATGDTGSITCTRDNITTGNCSMMFPIDTQIEVNAEPAPGFAFSHWDGWEDSKCRGSVDPECDGGFLMTKPHTLTAVFSGENLDIDVGSNVDVLDNSVVIYSIDVINVGTEDSGEATVDIQASGVGNGGEEISRRCDDQYNEGRGTCTKVNDERFKVTVKQGEKISIIASRYYGPLTMLATLGATVTYSEDIDPKDNVATYELQRNPRTLDDDLRTDIRLQYFDGKPVKERNTLVFTHGWQDTDPDDCEGLEGQSMLECFSKHLWSGMNWQKGQAAGLAMRNFWRHYYMGDAPNPIEERPNVIQYIWAGAFTQSDMTAAGYIKGRKHVFDAGTRLGKQLIEDLGSNYDGKIHFIGHSLGTAVNAYAVRYFLDHNSSARVQMTILDHPNRVSKIGKLLTDMSTKEEKQWGFNEHFFANVLPELNNPYESRLYVDNYFAQKIFTDTKINSTGVGTAISGRNVYNHLKDKGLNDPNDVGQFFFKGEGYGDLNSDGEKIFFNDHSGVHQWYRWTMWPDRTEYLRDNQFVCSNGAWIDDVDGTPSHSSLNPCSTGFAHSILREGWQPEDFDLLRNGYATDSSPAAEYDMVGGGTNQRCSMTENPRQFTCSKGANSTEYALAADQSESAATPIETTSDYLHTKINLSKEIGNFSFDYRLTNTDTKEPVHILIDGVVVWSMSAQSDTQGEWTASGKIPVALTKGEHTLMLAFNRTSEDAEFAMRELQFFEAPNKNGFLPAMLFLLLNK
ncbi:MAG: hypothetical protein D3915_06805, partial [Candidatus Electrothrix sp. AU1_5]|nr:hypothetical protein [Candidatus Electrothrix gigas]